MTLLLAAAAAGGGLVYLMNKKDKEIEEAQKARQTATMFIPDSGRFLEHSKTAGLAHSGLVMRSYPDVDLRGVPCHMVDYGGGSFTRVYAPPRQTAAISQHF